MSSSITHLSHISHPFIPDLRKRYGYFGYPGYQPDTKTFTFKSAFLPYNHN